MISIFNFNEDALVVELIIKNIELFLGPGLSFFFSFEHPFSSRLVTNWKACCGLHVSCNTRNWERGVLEANF